MENNQQKPTSVRNDRNPHRWRMTEAHIDGKPRKPASMENSRSPHGWRTTEVHVNGKPLKPTLMKGLRTEVCGFNIKAGRKKSKIEERFQRN